MPRTAIRSKTQDVITDNGSVLISIAKGEQLQIGFTLLWVSDLTGYTIEAKVVEGQNIPNDGTEPPLSEETVTKTITSLAVIDEDPSDNTFILVFPHDLIDAWDVQPTPDDPVYGFLAISVADTGVGNLQQIRVPVRGLLEAVYNPLESIA